MGQNQSFIMTSRPNKTFIEVGVSSTQGWRITMEDVHTILLPLPGDTSASFMAVYDGHGGSKVAEYAGQYLHDKIVGNPSYKEGNIVAAIQQAFLDIDEDMFKDANMLGDTSGSAALVVILKDKKIYCGNAGDSRAIACVRGIVQQLSFDHKPYNASETARINAAGGYVELSRVNGNLALSRALGDFCFKMNPKKKPEKQIVTAFPDVIVKDITPDHYFVVLASDGIWEVLSNSDVVDFITSRIAKMIEPAEICRELLMSCMAPKSDLRSVGCDNMTAIICCFLNGKSYEDLAQKCANTLKMER